MSQEEDTTDPMEEESHISAEQVKGYENEFTQRNDVDMVIGICGAVIIAFQGTGVAFLWTRLPR